MSPDDRDNVWNVRNAGMSARPGAATYEIEFDEMHTGLIETLAFLTIDCESRFPLVYRREYFNTSHQAVVSRIADLHVDDPHVNRLEDWECERCGYT
jgi:hypothetical protein